MLKGGVTGPSLLVNESDKSLIIQAVATRNEKLQMPPDAQLIRCQIADLEAWINVGAPLIRVRRSPFQLRRSRRRPRQASVAKLEEGEKHGAYQKPIDHPPPAVKNEKWPRNSIDRFSPRANSKRMA
jgi:hypothetical protein